MYAAIKNILKIVVPKSFLQKNEAFLRTIHASIFYRGKNCQCNICENQFSRFILLENLDELCPFCGSLSRNRLLWKILSEDLNIKSSVLHFSPSRSLYRKLKSLLPINYTSTDFEDEFLADKQLDITQIDEPDSKFDFVICYHVLEHIVEDEKAMKELFRVLKKGGKAIIQTPFKEGEVYEDYSVTSKAGRLKHFGQEDHVRVYAKKGLAERLEKAGFQVDIRVFVEIENAQFWGFKKEETVLVCKK